MGDRIRSTKKSRGKAIATDTAPSEHPDDLPKGFFYKFSWTDPQNNKTTLLEIASQGKWGYCWTYAYNRMISAHLFIHEKVGSLLKLSPKHLFAHIDEKFSNGFLKNYKGLEKFLTEDGLVTEIDCKCIIGKKVGSHSTVACDKVKDKKVYKINEFIVVEGKDVNETELIRLLKTRGPISIEIQVTEEYSTKGNCIYYGPSKNEMVENHIVLATGYNTDKNGISYFEFQNTWGLSWGVKGLGKLARKICLPVGSPSLIKSYMYPELLDQNLDA